jgi:hypothetical protein
MNLSKKARDWNIALTTLYAASAATCWTACILTITGNMGAAIAEGACAGAGVATAAVDIGATIKLTIDGTKSAMWWEKSLGSVGTALGGTGALLAGGKAVAVGVEMAPMLINNASLKDASRIASAAISNHVGKKVAEKVGTEGAKKAGDLAKNAMTYLSCVSAGLFTTVAVLKSANLALSETHRKKECKKVSDLEAFAAGYIPTTFGGSDPSGSGSGGGQTAGTTRGAAGQSMAGTTTATADSPDFQNIVGSGSTFPNSVMSSEMATGALKDVFNQLPNRNQIGKEFENGQSLQALAKNLMSQPAGAAIAGAVPGMPSELASELNRLDDLARQGKIGGEGFEGAYSSGGGGGSLGSTSRTSPLGAFSGFRGADTASTPKETSFTKKSTPTVVLSGDGDIWHSSWNGSIFQIITLKLGQNRERIDQLEWTTPLNRALSGLPKLQEKPVYKYDLKRGKSK